MTSRTLDCPVLHPTLQDILSLTWEEYITKHERKIAAAGVVRIVAPASWVPRKAGYGASINNLQIDKPIRQHATGQRGLYRMLYIEQKPMQLKQFAEIALDKENLPSSSGAERSGNTDAADLERKFWKNVTIRPPLYGADIPGSLFDEKTKGWNLRRLDTLLSSVLDDAGFKLPGVNTPYLYFGQWRSVFAWHTEDLDLYSVNYLHFGAPKQWYVVPPEHRARFESVMQGLVPQMHKQCGEFLRHKELLVSPQFLEHYQIPYVKVVQHPHEFVVTYPGAYHAGFNQGYNCAESVNFATKRWIPIGARAGTCNCNPDSVKINMKLFRHLVSDKLLPKELLESSSDEEDDDDEDGGGGSDDDGGEGSDAGSEQEDGMDTDDSDIPSEHHHHHPHARAKGTAGPSSAAKRGTASTANGASKQQQQPVSTSRRGMASPPGGRGAANGVASPPVGRTTKTASRAASIDPAQLARAMRAAKRAKLADKAAAAAGGGGAQRGASQRHREQPQQAAAAGGAAPAAAGAAATGQQQAAAHNPTSSQPELADGDHHENDDHSNASNITTHAEEPRQQHAAQHHAQDADSSQPARVRTRRSDPGHASHHNNSNDNNTLAAGAAHGKAGAGASSLPSSPLHPADPAAQHTTRLHTKSQRTAAATTPQQPSSSAAQAQAQADSLAANRPRRSTAGINKHLHADGMECEIGLGHNKQPTAQQPEQPARMTTRHAAASMQEPPHAAGSSVKSPTAAAAAAAAHGSGSKQQGAYSTANMIAAALRSGVKRAAAMAASMVGAVATGEESGMHRLHSSRARAVKPTWKMLGNE